jgi:hypothetical protein
VRPVLVRRVEIPGLRKLAKQIKRRNEKSEQIELNRIYRCMICGGNAVKTGDSVVCLGDDNHVFSLELYSS